MHDDDTLDDWIDGLSGRRPERGNKDEAAVLRQLVLAESQRPESSQLPGSAQAPLTPVLSQSGGSVVSVADYRARRAASAADPADIPRGRHRSSIWKWSSGIGVAAVILLSLAVFHNQHSSRYYPIEPAQRGSSDDLQVLEDEHPRARAESLSAKLISAGAQVDIYQRGEIYTLDINVLPENAQAITQELKNQGIEAPHRSVRVRIRPR